MRSHLVNGHVGILTQQLGRLRLEVNHDSRVIEYNTALQLIERMEDHLEGARFALVEQMRSLDYSWETIGEYLGMSKQAAWERYH
jgi:hypothetical protein